MTFEIIWYVGAPAAALALVGVALLPNRMRRQATSDDDVIGDELPLVLALGHQATADVADPAILLVGDGAEVSIADASEEVGPALEGRPQIGGRGTFGARLFSGPIARVRSIRRRAHDRSAAVACNDERAEALPVGMDDDASLTATSSWEAIRVVGPVISTTAQTGIIELDPQGTESGEWSADIAQREAALRAQLAPAAEDAAGRAEERGVAATEGELRRHDAEGAAIAAAAHAREETPPRRWFHCLDPELAAPSADERIALAATLAIGAPWAGRMLCEALAGEEEPRVRARMIGTLAAGQHFAKEPVEAAFARGGIERAAVWEALGPYRGEFAWIEGLLT